MFKSIYGRLFWTYSIVLIVAMSITLGAMSGFYVRFINDRHFADAQNAVDNIAYLTIVVQDDIDDYRVRSLYNTALASWSDIVGADVTVIDQNGEVFASTNRIKIVPTQIAATILAGDAFRKYTSFGSYYEKPVYSVGLPIRYNDAIIGGVIFNTTSDEILNSLAAFLKMLLTAVLVSFVIAFFVIYHHAKKIAQPISMINSAALDIASGKFDKRLPVTTSDEVGQLASSFNYMADSLEKLEDMRQNFISDVSHELRTPMTSISGFVGGILDGTIPPGKQEEYLRVVLEESQRLSRMVSDMLEMSKMSSSEYKLDMKKFDICEVARIAIISLENKMEQKSLELDVSFAHEQINVLADKDSILRVIINLLDNAVKFSYENTKITVSVWCDIHSAYVRVGNFGIGIEQKELSNIFDRFYKTDKSRGRDKSGAGLGLSMAKNIMKLHNSRIWAESTRAKEGSDVKYTTFTFCLELA